MTTVACVYWKGKFRGRERLFNPEWVAKLQRMIERNLPEPHRFVCLTNTDVPCEKIPLVNNWPGYWSKLELFRPDLFEGRVLFMDLDVLVLKDVTPILEFDSKFAMSATTGIPKIKEGKRMLCQQSSSVMVWDAGWTDPLYEHFIESPKYWMGHYFGDQDFISGESQVVGGADTLPFAWAKKLRDCPDFNPTKEMIVAYCQLGAQFPGKNYKVLEVCPWAREIWV